MRAVVVIAALGAAFAAAAPPAAAFTNAQVPGLQVALRAHGVYRGPIDGVAGPQTAAAVRAFQRLAKLPVDGVAGRRTRAALGPLGKPLFGRRVLRGGAVGWDVSVLQFLLRQRGVDPGGIDGRFGAGTRRALRRFQRRAGLAVDGIAGPSTMAALDSSGTRVPFASAAPTARHYTVRPGDTLTGIAARYGTTLSTLARTNRLDPNRFLLVGARLRVPTGVVAGRGEVRALLDRWAAHYGVDARLVRALAWQESGYQPQIVSHAGAHGVMQVTGGTWEFVETVLLGRSMARTTEGNIRVGTAFLAHLLRRFRGDERLAVGAYYQGARSVRRHGLFRETRRYVANVLALKSRV